jgi:hypothetical protein
MKSTLSNVLLLAILLLALPLSSQVINKADLYLMEVLKKSIATGKADARYFDLMKVKESMPSDCIAARHYFNKINQSEFRENLNLKMEEINKEGKMIGVNWQNIEYLKSEITYFEEEELGNQKSAKGYVYFLSAGKRYRIRFKHAIINPETQMWVSNKLGKIEKI